jgi:hypothetical protein
MARTGCGPRRAAAAGVFGRPAGPLERPRHRSRRRRPQLTPVRTGAPCRSGSRTRPTAADRRGGRCNGPRHRGWGRSVRRPAPRVFDPPILSPLRRYGSVLPSIVRRERTAQRSSPSRSNLARPATAARAGRMPASTAPDRDARPTADGAGGNGPGGPTTPGSSGRRARRLGPAKPGRLSQVSCGQAGFVDQVVDGGLVGVAGGA